MKSPARTPEQEYPGAPTQAGLLPIEGWRGVAALMVLATHWAPALGWRNPVTDFAFTGVDVFFVISGFVFAPTLLGQHSGPLGDYARRRVMRIYPAYLVALAVYAALTAWQGRPLLYLGEHLLMAHVQNREMAFYYAAPFWSLPSELEFYALVPLLGWCLARAPASAWWALLGLALLLRGVLVIQADGAAQNAAYVLLHHLPGLLIEFLLGAWAWQQHSRRAWQAQSRARWALAGGVVWALCLVVHHQLETGPGGAHWKHGQMGLLVAAGFALVLASTAGLRPQGAWAMGCQWAGRMSYGVYLLHMAWLLPMAAWVAAYGPAAAAALSACGLGFSVWLLNRWVEEPLRRWARGAPKA